MKFNIEKKPFLYFVFLALLGATPPLSTDMYLAAIPRIALEWGVGKDLVTLTLVLWFAFFSLFILVAGSLSDKFGRKPVLLVGLTVFAASSFLCAISQNVYQLILFRIFQGMGAGAPSAVVMAIIRDRFMGEKRRLAIAYVMTIVSVAPMLAPLIGALLMEFFTWRFIFLAQGAMGIITLLVSLNYTETIEYKLPTGLFKLVTRYAVHFKNKEFMVTSLSMGILVLPFFGFIAFSPIYYISIHGLSEKMFSLFFGLNAMASMLGAVCSAQVVRLAGSKKTLTISVAGCAFSGLGITLLAGTHYLFFFIFMAFFSFWTGVSRPVSGALMLGLVKTDVGSASSFMVFYQFISGAVCMAFVTLHWQNPPLVFGLLTLCVSLLVLVLWLKVAKKLNPIY